MTVEIRIGDCRELLRAMPDESVHCVVTSPPYWGLRDYGVSGQLGMERTLGEHIAVMVDVFREVRRVLRKDGTCWINYGDCYATTPNGRSAAATKAAGSDDRTFRDKPFSTVGPIHDDAISGGYLKPKDLCMVPERLFIALQDDGWWVRSKLPWLKRNGMPESISDRPATSIEQVVLLSKAERYWYDAEAVMFPTSPNTNLRVSQDVASQIGSARANGGRKTNGNMKAVVRRPKLAAAGAKNRANDEFENAIAGPAPFERNFRNSDLFWLSLVEPLGLISDPNGLPIALDATPQGFSDAHFATFPPKLIEPMILAGCPAGGTVLDPFGGAGTTGLVADRLGRNAILLELNPEYAAMARRRIEADAGMFASVA